MKNIKTYEGFFDFFKKKSKYEPVSMENITDCLLDLIDESRIKFSLSDETKIFQIIQRDQNIVAFEIFYNSDQISDKEVSGILDNCKYSLESFDCKVIYQIHRFDYEFSDFNQMIDEFYIDSPFKIGSNRSIILKIKALGGIEE